MKLLHSISLISTILCAVAVDATYIASINGKAYRSSYAGSKVTSVTGLVTAVGPDGLWLRSTSPDTDDRTSESIYVYSDDLASQRTVGDIITLSAYVSDYRSSADYLYQTELTSPSSVTVQSTGNTVTPVILGTNTTGLIGNKNLTPPNVQFTLLDNGDVFGVPYNTSQLSSSNPTLQPSSYGLDFWKSLSGELVTIRSPTIINKANSYGESWVVGDWPKSAQNKRGGLTAVPKDGNPEALIIGTPLDGTKNPRTTKIGDSLKDITGILTYQFGSFYVLPQTAINVTSSASPTTAPASQITSSGTCSGFTFGDYNCDNLAYNSSHLTGVAKHIANYLKSPSIVFLQEIQDNDGPTDDGVVDANKTLSTLTAAIKKNGGISYSWVDIDPTNDAWGGQPGGNIRSAYLYDASVVSLYNPNPGSATSNNEVLAGPTLKYNPGIIGAGADAFADTRLPLVAQWITADGKNTFFTIALHLSAKLGSTGAEGDERTPVNSYVDKRNDQLTIVGNFTNDIVNKDANAAVIIAGDFNEYAFVKPVQTLASITGFSNLNDVAAIDDVERYTYVYQQSCQEIDQIFVSKKIAGKSVAVEHVHVNTWATTSSQVSDHDPTVFKLNICQ